MKDSNGIHGLIHIPHLRVRDANTISGPITWGFPAPSAFVGFTHALGRRLDLDLWGTGIVCHKCEPQTLKRPYKEHRFKLTKNPICSTEKNANGGYKQPSIVEDGRVHMEVSLILGLREKLTTRQANQLLPMLYDTVMSMRVAGGAVFHSKCRRPMAIHSLDTDELRRVRYRLLPGFALVHRPEPLRKFKAEHPDLSLLDALLHLTRLNTEYTEGSWVHTRGETNAGWRTPIPVGYGSISPLHPTAVNARDQTTPFRFVEALYSLGEWVSPHRLADPRELLWFPTTPHPTQYMYDHIDHQ